MKKNLIAAILMMAVSMGAMAGESGAYMGVSVGGATSADSNGNSGISGTGLGIGITVGKSFNKYVGVEGSLNLIGITGWPNVMALPISIAAIGHAPIGEKTALYGKVGAAYTTLLYSNTTFSGITGTYGFGIELIPDGKQTLRIGVEHYDLSVVTGTSVSSNFIGITNVEHF